MDMFAVLFRNLKNTEVRRSGPNFGEGDPKLMLVTAQDERHARARAFTYLYEFNKFNRTFFLEGKTGDEFDRRHRHCWVLEDPETIEAYVARIESHHPTVRADHDAVGFRFLLYPLERVGFDEGERRMIGLQAVEYALKR